jgi:4,5-DOPA dioxygenase extradiol
VHNLRLVQWRQVDHGFDWAHRFDDTVCEQLAHDPANILSVTGHADYARAVPTPEHFLPLLYIAGLATKREPVREVVRGYSMGSLSMTCYAVGADLEPDAGGAAAASLPEDVPADNTNT